MDVVERKTTYVLAASGLLRSRLYLGLWRVLFASPKLNIYNKIDRSFNFP